MKKYVNLFVDSGAFSAWRQGTPIDLNKYIEWLKRNQHLLESYVSLDEIPDKNRNAEKCAQLSFDNFQRMKDAGLHPIPVFHINERWKWLEKLLDAGEQYIGLGGVAVAAVRGHRRDVLRWLDDCFTIMTDKNGHPLVKTHGFGITAHVQCIRYPWYCMTNEHEVLTRNGWSTYENLKIGDEILCYDNGTAKWEKILEVPKFEVEDTPIHKSDYRAFSMRVTPNHKWLVRHRVFKKWSWKTTEQLRRWHQVPRAPDNYQAPEKMLSDELVELMAWFWTEGTIYKRPKYKKDSIVIYQSISANPTKVERIRQVLKKAGENYCEVVSKRDHGIDASFELYGEARDWLLETAPDKKVPLSFLWKLTEKQLKLFVEVSILADGHKTNLKRTVGYELAQAKPTNIDMFRIACMLAGFPTSQNEQKHLGHIVTTSSVNWAYPASDLAARKVENYSGVVWCVRVPSKAFFTRCNGTIYVTGNSVDSTTWITYANYGHLYVPRYTNSRPDYSKPPIQFHISSRVRSVSIRHPSFDVLSPAHQDAVIRFLSEQNLTLSEVRNKFIARHHLQLSYYLEMEKQANWRFDRPPTKFHLPIRTGISKLKRWPLRVMFGTAVSLGHSQSLNKYDIRNRLLSYNELKDFSDETLKFYVETGLPHNRESKPQKTNFKRESYWNRRRLQIMERDKVNGTRETAGSPRKSLPRVKR